MEYLLKASAVIVLFYLCFHIFLKKETFFEHNRWFLLIGIVVALIFPFIVIPIHIAVEPMIVPETVYTISENIPINIQKPIPESKFEWQTLLPIIYGIGLIVFLTQFIFQFGSLILLLLKNPKNRDGVYTYVIVNNTVSPFSFFKWIVYNPESFNNEELKLMLTHEKVHANQLHSLDILLIQLACSIFWFNPLMWLYRKEVRQNLEYIADYKTQEESNSEIEYQRLLLKTSVTNHNISLSNNFYNSLIKERIVMLKKSRSNRKKQWRYLLMLPLLAGMLMSMNTEKIYVESEIILKESSQPTLEFVVTKNTTDAELKAMSDAIENKGGTLVFSDIIRNEKKELVNIFLKLNNHKYGYTNNTTPIDSFIIYKEFFGSGGGYVGRINGATLHFDIDTNDKKFIDALTKRAHKSIIKKGVQKSFTSESIKVTFTKMMTDGSIKKHKEFLKSKGVIMTLNELKRNKNNEIIDINIDFETENSSANYNVKNKSGIKSFYFKMDEDGSFGVGASKDNDVVIVETINIDNAEQKPQKAKSKYKFVSSSKIVPKLNSGDSIYGVYNYSFSKDTLVYGKNIIIDSAEVKRLSHIKTGYFYESDTPIEVIPKGEAIKIFQVGDKAKQSANRFANQDLQPLIIIDGKVGKKESLKIINPNDIEQMNVLKGDNAIALYGEKGKNGVIEITSKSKNTNTAQSQSIKNSPWKISTGVNKVEHYEIKDSTNFSNKKSSNPWKIDRSAVTSIQYIDEDNLSNSSMLIYISKFTNDLSLDQHKEKLELLGLSVKYSKLKRDKTGDIISLKISLKDNEGNKSSASFKDDEGIPDIGFGLSDGKLLIRSTKN